MVYLAIHYRNILKSAGDVVIHAIKRAACNTFFYQIALMQIAIAIVMTMTSNPY